MTRRSKRKSAAKAAKNSSEEAGQVETDESLIEDTGDGEVEGNESGDVEEEVTKTISDTPIDITSEEEGKQLDASQEASGKNIISEDAGLEETKPTSMDSTEVQEASEKVNSSDDVEKIKESDNNAENTNQSAAEGKSAEILPEENVTDAGDASKIPLNTDDANVQMDASTKGEVLKDVESDETKTKELEGECTEKKGAKGDNDGKTSDSRNSKPVDVDMENFEVVDEIDLTKSDDEGMEVGEEDEAESDEREHPQTYVIPDYDDPSVTTLDIDPEQDGKGKIKESDDFVKYWRTVVDNPQEFTSWTYLLQYVEQEGKLPLARRAYNSFFGRYPLCYGYWKKFSELERKHGNVLRAQKILERGVRAIPLSIDLWVHVIDFYIGHYSQPDAGVDKARKIFKRAIDAAGEEFRSEKLWNKYIKWEVENKSWMGVMEIYDRALQTQTQHYSILFNDFKEFVNAHSPTEILTIDEFQKALAASREAIAANALVAAEEKSDEKKEGEDVEMDEAPPGVEDHEKPPSEEELKAIKLTIIKEKKKLYDITEQAVTKIWAFEEGIKRPYFHVKQLERAQLKNWREYLDMEIARGDHHRTVLLFERCLIACALYEDFWLKYAKYMAQFEDSKARRVYERACLTHLPKKPNIHVQWAAHEEVLGNREEAATILEKLDNVVPGMAMIKMRRVAVERRAGNIQVAEDLLRCYVASAAKDKEEVFYTRKLAWFLLKISNNKEEAKKLLKDLIPKYKSELKLYNDLVEMEFHCAGQGIPNNENAELLAMDAFEVALMSEKLNDDQKFNFSQRKLEYLEDYGCDAKRLQKVYDEHQKLIRSQKKRTTQIDLTNEETPAKKQKSEATTISVVGTSSVQIANGSRYTNTTAAATYANQQATYSSGDPNMYHYQQQQQSYWNYQKPSEAQQYNYNQWSQYYAGHHQ